MGKKIILGITGGIAAYKMAHVASTLTKKGHEVRVVMTESATEFISPMTFSAITHNRVATDLFSFTKDEEIPHIALTDDADVMLIAPTTANVIAKLAGGIADDLLSTMVLAMKSPVLIAPAMNVNMYNNPVVKDNLDYLRDKGYIIIPPGSGYLACGDEGEGRLPEPSTLVEYIEMNLRSDLLKNYRVLVTAGPTREPLDPVRYLSNFSSGKMGYEIARTASYLGAEVKLISGPTSLSPPVGVETIKVETAREMANSVNTLAPEQDIIIMVAAVADFRPENESETKIKKGNENKLEIKLTSNPDILSNLGNTKQKGQLLIGFAAESEELINNARAKLEQKNLDMIVANDISSTEIGFASDYNKVMIITEEEVEKTEKMNKSELAEIIITKLIKKLNKQ